MIIVFRTAVWLLHSSSLVARWAYTAPENHSSGGQGWCSPRFPTNSPRCAGNRRLHSGKRADPYTAVRPVHSDDCTFLCRQGQHGGPCGLCFVQRKAECIPCPACKRDAARQTVQRDQFFQRERGTIFGAASVGIGQRNSACCQMNAVRRNTGRQSRHRLHLQCSRVIRHQNAAGFIRSQCQSKGIRCCRHNVGKASYTKAAPGFAPVTVVQSGCVPSFVKK